LGKGNESGEWKQKWGRACFDIEMLDQELNVHELLMEIRFASKVIVFEETLGFKKIIILYVMGGNINAIINASIPIIDVLTGDLEENIFGVGASIELNSIHIH